MSRRGEDSVGSQEAEFEADAKTAENRHSGGTGATGRGVIYDDDDYVPRRPWRRSRLEEDNGLRGNITGIKKAAVL